MTDPTTQTPAVPADSGGSIVISVIIPHLNQSGMLERCLASLRAGRRVPDEIIVVNDGSTDDTVNILSSYEKEDNRIKVIRNEKNLKLIKKRLTIKDRLLIITFRKLPYNFGATFIGILDVQLVALEPLPTNNITS